MSSRILSRDEFHTAEPLVWPPLEGQFPLDTGCGTSAAAQSRRDEVQREVEGRVQAARAAGVQEGMESARAAAAAEIKALQGKVAEAIADLAEFRPRLRRQAEGDLVKLALAIARRILHRELAVDPEAMRGLMQAALEKLQAQEICRVRVHPSQEPLVRSLLAARPQASPVQLQTDASLDRGAAVFETMRGNLDASVETQLREIEQGLADRLERA